MTHLFEHSQIVASFNNQDNQLITYSFSNLLLILFIIVFFGIYFRSIFYLFVILTPNLVNLIPSNELSII